MTEEAEPDMWEGVDLNAMDYLERAYFEDAMTAEEYQRYTTRNA